MWRTHSKNKKPHNEVWERRTEWCGDGEVEMVRIKVEKGYMTTPSVDEEK